MKLEDRSTSDVGTFGHIRTSKTGWKVSAHSGTARIDAVYETEKEAKQEAEKLRGYGWTNVRVFEERCPHCDGRPPWGGCFVCRKT